MAEQQPSIDAVALSCAHIAGEAYGDQAAYLRSLPESAWGDPTGCSEWTVRDLAGHVVGEAVWYPNLVRGVTRGEPPLPDDTYPALKTLPSAELTDRLSEAASAIEPAIRAATPDQLQQTVDLGFTKLPLWQSTYVSMIESVYHHWDSRAGRDPEATIPTPWALQVAAGISGFAPMIANQEGVAEAPGRYLLHVEDGVGPVTITARDGQVTVEAGALERPDVAFPVTADQYVRLIAGRLDLARLLGQGGPALEGDRDKAMGLLRIFQGIG